MLSPHDKIVILALKSNIRSHRQIHVDITLHGRTLFVVGLYNVGLYIVDNRANGPLTCLQTGSMHAMNGIISHGQFELSV